MAAANQINKHLTKLRFSRLSNNIPGLITVLGVAVIGTVLLFKVLAATSTYTFSGAFSKQGSSASYAVGVTASGTATATVSFNKTISATLNLVDSSGAVIATASGSGTMLNVSAPVSSGNYSVSLAGSKISSRVNYNLTVTVPVTDTSPPSVAITSPTNAATVSGTINVTGTASDNAAVSSVAVSVDNGIFANALGTTNWSYSLSTLSLSNGSHTLTARATDSSNNTSTVSITVAVNNPTVDTTPPTAPTGLSGTAASSSGINLSWAASTDPDNAASSLTYRVFRNSTQVATTAAGVTTYQDSGLLASTSYNYYVVAVDPSNNSSPASSVVTAQTQSVADTTPPTVSITNPNSGSTVTNTISVTGTATDNVSVSSVQVSVDNGTFANATLASPGTTSTSWSYAWNTASVANGSHTLTVVAIDSSGNKSSSYVTVNVSNVITGTPSVTISSPANNSSIGGTTTITGTATGNIVNVQILVSGNGITPYYLMAKGTSTWSVPFNSVALTGGSYTLTAVETVSGTTTRYDSSPINVNVATYTVPSVSVTSIVSGATLSGMVNLSGTASAVAGLTSVSAFLTSNGSTIAQLPVSGTAAWSTSLDTTQHPDCVSSGCYNIVVIGRDKYGYNQAASLPVTIANNKSPGVTPTITLASPVSGSTVSGTVTFSGTTTGQVNGVSCTILTINGQSPVTGGKFGPTTGVYNWSEKLDTTKLPNGTVTIECDADAIINNIQYNSGKQITLTISNPAPSVSITSPASNGSVSGVLTISGTANDSSSAGLASVALGIDNITSAWRPAEGTSSWSQSINTYGLTNGAHTIQAIAFNRNGTPSATTTITINVNNTAAPTSLSTCPDSYSTHPTYDQYTANNATVAVCTLENAWTAKSIYDIMANISDYPGIRNFNSPGSIGNLELEITDDSTTGNGFESTTSSGGTNNDGGWQAISSVWACGGGPNSITLYYCIGHEYGHSYLFGGEYANPANWDGTSSAPWVGYPEVDNAERAVGVYGNPSLKTAYEHGDYTDSEAETYKELFGCYYGCPFMSSVDWGGTGGPLDAASVPGWSNYLANTWWGQ